MKTTFANSILKATKTVTEKAVVKSYGSFVVCCVCANGSAEKTIDDIMSK